MHVLGQLRHDAIKHLNLEIQDDADCVWSIECACQCSEEPRKYRYTTNLLLEDRHQGCDYQSSVVGRS